MQCCNSNFCLCWITELSTDTESESSDSDGHEYFEPPIEESEEEEGHDHDDGINLFFLIICMALVIDSFIVNQTVTTYFCALFSFSHCHNFMYKPSCT